ncbi:winged helix-turn-helix domain-containing protein [Providencia burhodogranariea]|uniref:OmpR/PhoB-type domain-containing protein n=1 Tax=Providencia burhodogranariea DSM 19968 TaxID=1141662 RepID=K8X845_9GAMM|nr:winged helix-turn-helix domain-containing protein [Providencia burhodogranariea]EKT64600.1 hypothetical protein OOA_02347 [Providencia burhodogranariea DSM 19968]
MKDYTLGKGIQFNLIKCTISSEQQEVMLGSRETKLLELFCENPNQVLNKTLMTDTVWGAVVVSETSLTKAISNLRKALSRFSNLVCEIKTIPKEGYIFIFENKCENWNVEENILPEKDGSQTAYLNKNQESHTDNSVLYKKPKNRVKVSFSLISLTIFSSLISSAVTATVLGLINFS